MLANPLPSKPISINQLVLLSYKRAGLLPVDATVQGANMTQKLEHGRVLLDTILDSLATEGFTARNTELYDLAIVAGSPSYTLPDHLLDAVGDAMFVAVEPDSFDPLRTSGELACKQVDIATWQAITVKDMESTRPQLYAAFRSGVYTELRLWPVPSENGILRLKVVRLLGGNDEGKRPVDLQRYWQDALIWMLAYYLATDSSLPTERCIYLAQVSEAKKVAALRYNTEHVSIQCAVSYPTQWSA